MSQTGPDRSPRGPKRRAAKVLVLGLLLVAATACSSDDLPRLGMPKPITSEGPEVLSLWQGSWIAAFAVGALVWGLILWSAFFHRRKRTKQEIPPQVRYNLPIELLYTIVPVIIVCVFFYFTARDESHETRVDANNTTVINVVGRQWSWTFNYNFKPTSIDATKTSYAPPDPSLPQVYDVGTPSQLPTLWLPVGEKVEFVLTSPDVIHSFWVPDFLFKMDVIPGRINTFQITPTVEGTFEGKCAELCGVDHSRMLFNVKVVSPAEYAQHLQDLKNKGQTGQEPWTLTQLELAPDQVGRVNA